MTIANPNHRTLSRGEYDMIDAGMAVVDETARAMEAKWGYGRLPYLVPIDLAERFRSQQRKLTDAHFSRDATAIRTHCEAMVRAYGKLEEVALSSGHQPIPPTQWEVEGPDGLVILVQDARQANLVDRGGRQAQVWTLEEVASVLRAFPVLSAAKDCFSGAVVETIRPKIKVTMEMLNDDVPGFD